MIINS